MLYEKVVSPGGKTTYKPFDLQAPSHLKAGEFSNREIVTWCVSLGMAQMMIMERMLPEHTKVARGVRKIEDAIVDVVKGLGTDIDPELGEYITNVWNLTAAQLARGLEG